MINTVLIEKISLYSSQVKALHPKSVVIASSVLSAFPDNLLFKIKLLLAKCVSGDVSDALNELLELSITTPDCTELNFSVDLVRLLDDYSTGKSNLDDFSALEKYFSSENDFVATLSKSITAQASASVKN